MTLESLTSIQLSLFPLLRFKKTWHIILQEFKIEILFLKKDKLHCLPVFYLKNINFSLKVKQTFKSNSIRNSRAFPLSIC